MLSRALCRTERCLISLCCGGKPFPRSSATRNAFYRGRHTCHARLLAFVTGLTNGPPHMARRARLRADFDPAASPFRSRRFAGSLPTIKHAGASRRIRAFFHIVK